ncbi:MAG: hypothetical protein PHO76_02595 [Methylotenera sp.]|nr:hypothetical protein [Methylotenera sp.]MDD4927232.1 hypothetical protein [Methylotenera sp.]
MSTLSDFFGTATDVLGVSSVADLYKTYNQQKIAIGLAKSTNTINELNASTEMLAMQVAAANAKAAANKSNLSLGNFDVKKYLPYALAVGGAYLAYKLIK